MLDKKKIYEVNLYQKQYSKAALNLNYSDRFKTVGLSVPD